MKNDKKPTARSSGGHARAAKLSPARRKAIAINAAKVRWDNPDAKAKNKPAEKGKHWVSSMDVGYVTNNPLRDEIAVAVMAGLYANIDVAQKFAAHVMGPDMLLPEAFTRIAYAQADEAIRLRSL